MAQQRGAGVLELCREGDQLLGKGEAERAAALYLAAFGRHAGSALSHMRGLGEAGLAEVVSTLEAWLDGPVNCSVGGSVNKGVAAVFLSTLSPNNLSASLYKMESLLLGGAGGTQSCEEVAARCSNLLEGNGVPSADGSTRLALELTRALAYLLSQPCNPTGLLLYLRAFRANGPETVRLLKSRQAQLLPRIVNAFLQHHGQQTPGSSGATEAHKGARNPGPSSNSISSSECVQFLVSLCPEDPHVQEVRAATLFDARRFEESADAYSLALQNAGAQTETDSSPIVEKTVPDLLGLERKAGLLVGRASAHFMAGGRASEACRDLGEAFSIHPATARLHFHRQFSENGTGLAARTLLRQQAERAISEFREAVQVRPNLRSSEGTELLDPAIAQLRVLCHLEPAGGSRELRVRLADCLLIRREFKEALSICNQLASAAPPLARQSYQNTVHVLRGYARLLSNDHEGAAEDFQAVIEHSAPHPSSCVRALCGRGLLRMLAGSPYLTALDYVTASRLQPQDTALAVRCLVPWNQRGLLCTVLLEQSRAMLVAGPHSQAPSPNPPADQGHQPGNRPQPTGGREGCSSNKEETAIGVHALAVLLTDLDPGTDGPQILAADALYCMGRVEEAYRLLLAVGGSAAPRSPVLARLAMLQLHRGFLYDANQLLKKLTQYGDTSCLHPLLDVAPLEDRALLQKHCHAAANRILEGQREEASIREAVAYLSIAIMASGGEATEALLARAQCYLHLGQRKTAIFDFSAILKEQTEHVQALCGRGFTYLMLNQQKECTRDILAALQVDCNAVTQHILSLKDTGRKLICDWLQKYCRARLSEVIIANPVPCKEEHLREAFLIGGALLETDSRDSRWHLLYVDTLLAKGELKAAAGHLGKVFGRDPREATAQARWGVVESWQQNFGAAGRQLSRIAEKDPSTLEFLLHLISPAQRHMLAQAAAREAEHVSECGQWEKALALLGVAVQSAGEGDVQQYRRRAGCLSRLGYHERAVSDLDRVVQGHGEGAEPGERAEDLCQRGRSLVLSSCEEAGLEDFALALELHRGRSLRCVDVGLGRQRLAQCFLHRALHQYSEQRLDRAWRLVESGLSVDGSHVELRRLRARIKREGSGSCIVH